MKKKLMAMTLSACMATSMVGVYGSTDLPVTSTTHTNEAEVVVEEVVDSINLEEDQVENNEAKEESVIEVEDIIIVEEVQEDTEKEEVVEVDFKGIAGILPDSPLYRIKLLIEKFQIAITQREEKLAELKARLAVKRAAEAAIMTEAGEDELANRLIMEYLEMFTAATNHINKAIEMKEIAEERLIAFNETYILNTEMLDSILNKTSEETTETLENAITEQYQTLIAVQDFYAVKKAFFEVKRELKEAKKELQALRKTGNTEAISVAQEKVKALESLKEELENSKDVAELAKEQIDKLTKETEKILESGFKHIEDADEEIEKIEEKIDELYKEDDDKEDEEDKEEYNDKEDNKEEDNDKDKTNIKEEKRFNKRKEQMEKNAKKFQEKAERAMEKAENREKEGKSNKQAEKFREKAESFLKKANSKKDK